MADFKIKELKGLRAIKAVNTYVKLVYGIAMTFFNRESSFLEFVKKFSEYPIEKKRLLLKIAILTVPLDDDEVESLTRFAIDGEGIAYEKPMLSNLKMSELIEIMIATALKIADIENDLYILTESEYKEIEPASIDLRAAALKALESNREILLSDFLNEVIGREHADGKKFSVSNKAKHEPSRNK